MVCQPLDWEYLRTRNNILPVASLGHSLTGQVITFDNQKFHSLTNVCIIIQHFNRNFIKTNQLSSVKNLQFSEAFTLGFH